MENTIVLKKLTCWLFSGRDVIAQAQSGTGKTATFSIAILEKLKVDWTECQALVLAPTRELAQQVIYQGSHKLWKTWKIMKKSSMHGKIMEFEKN